MIDEKNKVIGFVGLGLMGINVSQRLIKSGYTVVGCDKVIKRISRAVKVGVKPAYSPKEVMERSDIVLLCVTSTKDVEDVVFGSGGIEGGGARGKLIVDLSTTMASKTRSMALRINASHRIGWIDAPVSGGPEKALTGKLSMMIGGSKKDIKMAFKVLTTISSTCTRFGKVGTGQIAKMVNQILVLNNYVLIAEALALAEAGGIDASKIPNALRDGHAGSNLLTDLMPRMIARDFKARGYAQQILKDFDMLHEFAKELEVPNPMSSQSASLFRLLVSKGLGNLDGASIFKIYDKKSKF